MEGRGILNNLLGKQPCPPPPPSLFAFGKLPGQVSTKIHFDLYEVYACEQSFPSPQLKPKKPQVLLVYLTCS